MSRGQSATSLVDFLRVLRRQKYVIGICCVVVAAAALTISWLQPTEYSATASLLFRDPQFDQQLFGQQVVQQNTDPAREAATNLSLVSLPGVAARTATSTGDRLSPAAVQAKVSIQESGQADLATITATDSDRHFAASLANAYADNYIAFRREADRAKTADADQLVQRQLASLTPAQQNGPDAQALRERSEQLKILTSLQTGNAELVQPAAVPGAPSSPKPLRNTALGILLGLLFGIGAAVLLERVDRRLRDADDVEEVFELPILASVPRSPSLAHEHDDLMGAETEAFRMLRSRLRYFNVDRQIRSIMVTSAAPGDGKTTVASQLALTAAGLGARSSQVVLVEADLRRPTLAEVVGLGSSPGLAELLTHNISLPEATQLLPVPESVRSNGELSLDVLVAGAIPPNPLALIESDAMAHLLQELEANYELVIVDTPPTSVVSDVIPLVQKVSGVIVVSRLGSTSKDAASRLRSELERLHAPTLGVVVNCVRKHDSADYGYGYYGYADTKDGVDGRARKGAVKAVLSRD